MEFNIKDIEAEINLAEKMFDKAMKSADNNTLQSEDAMKIRKLLDKVHHELVKVYEIPDYTKTDHGREFIFDFERAFQHKGTPDGTEHLKKAIKASKIVFKDLVDEKKRREGVGEVIEKRKEKGLQ